MTQRNYTNRRYLDAIETKVNVLDRVLDTSLQKQSERANKACTGRWGFCGIFEHFPRFEFSLLPSRVRARPSASNASRWADKQFCTRRVLWLRMFQTNNPQVKTVL
jgi:hypothetical protein